MNIKFIFPFIVFFTLSGCQTVSDIKSWAFDDDQEETETVIIDENKSQFEYVTVNIKDKIAVKVADPLGPRVTGVGCAMWKSKTGESGRCAWNSKGQCFCPAPE
jgi:hypothetical protein|tara:strand:+ start:35835 stop:36146 length:312 start_codon:yes stop_codon:yes gene_type:complete